MQGLARAYRALVVAEGAVAASLLVAMVALVLAGGVSRAFGQPLNWTTDLATALFAWACFLCADIAWRRDQLMSIGWVTARLAPRAKVALRWVNYAIIAAFLVFAIVMGLWLSWVSRARSFQGLAGVSYSWVTLSLPVGCMLLLTTTVAKVRAEWDNRPWAPGPATPTRRDEAPT
jgi:TRAP-type C4-dicarboxylate transport system permease small subunit